jgi:hypothetical protein
VGTWYHVAATYNAVSKEVKVYRDGVLVYSGLEQTPPSTWGMSGPLFLGGLQNTGSNFDGVMDDVRVYNTVLTQSQIQADMSTSP